MIKRSNRKETDRIGTVFQVHESVGGDPIEQTLVEGKLMANRETLLKNKTVYPSHVKELIEKDLLRK